jgi:wzy protein
MFYTPFISNLYRRALFFIGMLSLTYIFASRSYVDELGADLSVYYSVFSTINNNANFLDIIFDFKIFGNGLEIGLICLYKLYSILFDSVTPIDLSVYNIIVSGAGLIIWYEIYGIKNIPPTYRAVCVAFILSFLSVTTFGYLQRQSLATVFILFALEMTKKRYIMLFTILASFCHLTSFPIIIVWKFFLKRKLTISLFMKSAIVIVSLRFLFDSIILLLFKAGFAKALFYLEMIDSTSIASVRFLILIFLLLITNLIFFRDNVSKWKTPITILSFFYILFLGIPLFSERISFVFLYLYGFFLFTTLYKQLFKTLIFLLIVYLFYFTLEKTNIITMPIDAFWSRYPVFSFEPFYYLNY